MNVSMVPTPNPSIHPSIQPSIHPFICISELGPYQHKTRQKKEHRAYTYTQRTYKQENYTQVILSMDNLSAIQWNPKLTAGEVVVGDVWSNIDPPLTRPRSREPATFTRGSDVIPVKSITLHVVNASILTDG